jgi:site-specific recombinase XerD
MPDFDNIPNLITLDSQSLTNVAAYAKTRLASKYLLDISNTRSRRTVKVGLEHFQQSYYSGKMLSLDEVPWHQINRHVLAQYRNEMNDDGFSFTTINNYLSSIRGILKTAWQEEVISTDHYLRTTSIANIKGERLPVGREITDEEMLSLFSTLSASKTLSSVRDSAIFGLALYGGLRRSELISIDYENINLRRKEMLIIGKGNKQRLLALNTAVLSYLEVYIDQVRRDDKGALFTRIRKNNDVTTERLTDQSVYYLFSLWCKTANIARIAPHDCRRTVATKLLDKGAPLSDVQLFLGHADAKTTKRYDMGGLRKQHNIAEMLL